MWSNLPAAAILGRIKKKSIIKIEIYLFKENIIQGDANGSRETGLSKTFFL